MISPEWPSLPFSEWEKTCDTLHMWTQIVGKTRLNLTPLQNHWWNVTLYVTPRGLTSSAIPFGRTSFEVEFDFLTHQLSIRTSEGQGHSIPLFPRSVADFYGEYMACLRSLGIEVSIHRTPDEFDDKTPFDQDQHHASYDAKQVESFRRVLINCDRVFKEFRSPFLGKCSPVHFFWGSFDLAVTRFSGRPAPKREGADSITREAYSHEVISAGFWPGGAQAPYPLFYSYAYPEPSGFSGANVAPPARYDATLREFILPYEEVRQADDPEAMLLSFLQSTYVAAAELGGWDRDALEVPTEILRAVEGW